jgi:hypothetical protein
MVCEVILSPKTNLQRKQESITSSPESLLTSWGVGPVKLVKNNQGLGSESRQFPASLSYPFPTNATRHYDEAVSVACWRTAWGVHALLRPSAGHTGNRETLLYKLSAITRP